MYLALTCMAALAFTIGGYFMKMSAGLTRLRPTLLVFGFFIVGACLQTLAMRGEQMSVTYIVVLGIEAISAFCCGVLFLKESTSVAKFAGLGLVVVGIVLLRMEKP